MKKYCTKCGHEFEAVGREVICPDCKAQAAEETKRAAVLRAKRASWTGESVPVRISGRASTVIREYGAAHNLPFAQALDALLKASDYFKGAGKAWEEVTPYKSHRRDKSDKNDKNDKSNKNISPIRTYLLSLQKEQEAKQDAPQEGKQTSKQASKPQEVKTAAKVTKTTSKASASKASKASKEK